MVCCSAGFDLTTRDFTILVKVFTNHILVKKTNFTNHIEWVKHKIIMVLKPVNKHQIIWQCHNFKTFLSISSFIYFFIKQKFCKHNFLQSWKQQTAKKKQFIIQTSTYCLIYSSTRTVFCKIVQYIFHKAWFPLWCNMR